MRTRLIVARGLPVLRHWLVLPLVLTAVLLALDPVPRFYQGDSLAYLTTGLNNWIPPDRSWAYGYASRWLVTWSHRIWILLAVQAGLLAAGIALLQHVLRASFGWRRLRWLLPLALILDPLDQATARTWLSDTVACALFLFILAGAAVVLFARGRSIAWTAGAYSGLGLLVCATLFLRVAYAPVLLGLSIVCLLATLRPDAGSGPERRAVRRALTVFAVLPVIGALLLAQGNSRVAMPRFRGHASVNQMSRLYTMFVLLPGLHRADLERAGIAITPEQFAALHVGRYDAREGQLWDDGPGHLRWLMQQEIPGAGFYDARLQTEARAVVGSVLLHHPQDLLAVYLWSTCLYLSPAEWSRVMPGELGLDRPLPDWTRDLLRWWTGRDLSPAITVAPSVFSTIVTRVAWAYPFGLVAGLLAAGRLLVRRTRLDAADLVAAAMVASFLIAPLYSHAVKPRYVLASVLLAGWCIALATTAIRGEPASDPPVIQRQSMRRRIVS